MRIPAAIAAPVVTLLLLTGCTAPGQEPAPAPASSSSSTPAGPAVQVGTQGMDKDLGNFANDLYRDKKIAANQAAATALQARQAVTTSVDVAAATGTWNKEEFAVLTSGKDVTLAVLRKGEWTAVGGWWPSLGIDSKVLGGKRHVLMIGSDAREKKGEKIDEERGDALQVVGVDGKGGAGVMSVPRDLWVAMPGGGMSKINSAMVQSGPEGQVKAVATATGLDIEGYVLTGFTGFQKMIDELGGITIDAPMKVRGVPKGKHKVDGYDAFWFSRERKTLPNGDFDRSFNQGIALAGIAGKAVAEGPAGMARILDVANKHVETNLDAEQALTLGAWAYQTKLSKVGHKVVPADYGWSADGQSILRINSGSRAVFKDFADGNLGK